MNNKNHIINISRELTQIQALNLIASEYKLHRGLLVIDFSHAGFRLTRDFLFVLVKRFHSDSFSLILSHESEVSMARSLGIEAQLV